MANGPRIVRQGGFKSSSGLDNLMQVLQVTGNIAGNIQQNRNRRDSTQTSFLSALTQGFESNYSSQSISNMRNKIAEYKQNNLNNMSADAMDMFGIAEMRLKEHSENLNHYDTMIGNIDALPNQAYGLVEQLASHGSLPNQAEKDVYAQDNWEGKTRKEKEDELIGVYQSYGTNMRDFMGRHGERINRNNPYLAKKYLELENVLLSSVSALDDGRISPNEQKFLKENLKTPNPLKIQQWNNRNNKEIAWMDEKNRDQIYKMGEQYKNYDDILKLGLFTPEGDDEYEGDETFPVGSDADIRNYYVRQGHTGDDLENKVAEAKTHSNNLKVQRAFYLAEANTYNTAYKTKHEIDILEGLGITVPDYSKEGAGTGVGTGTGTGPGPGLDAPPLSPDEHQSAAIGIDTTKRDVDLNLKGIDNEDYRNQSKDQTESYKTALAFADNVKFGGDEELLPFLVDKSMIERGGVIGIQDKVIEGLGELIDPYMQQLEEPGDNFLDNLFKGYAKLNPIARGLKTLTTKGRLPTLGEDFTKSYGDIDKYKKPGYEYFKLPKVKWGKVGVEIIDEEGRPTRSIRDISGEFKRGYAPFLTETDYNQIHSWHEENIPKAGAQGHDNIAKNLRKTFFNEDSSEGLEYKDLLKMKEQFDKDTEKYDQVLIDIDELEAGGMRGTQVWKSLQNQKWKYGIKYLGWGAKMKKVPFIGEKSDVGPWEFFVEGKNYNMIQGEEADDPKKNKYHFNAKNALDLGLRFYEELFSDIVNKKSKGIDYIQGRARK